MKNDIYLRGKLTGFLESSRNGITFRYSSSNVLALSVYLPVREEPYNARSCIPFFSNLLPDEWEREKLAQNVGVRAAQTLPLVSAVAGDTAGAVSVLPEGGEYREDGIYKEVPEEMTADRIGRKDEESLLYWGQDTRSTIAGAQSKMCFYYEKGKWFIPKGNSPTNTIVKPSEELSLNEYVVTRLASLCSIQVHDVFLHEFEGRRALVAHRYDRVGMRRIHQEDMCQALGILPENKYEEDGGPGIRNTAEVIRKFSSAPGEDMRRFAEIIVFNYIVGNCDSHGKNYSLLHLDDGGVRLAPFYDLLSTTVYEDISRSLSMRIGQRRRIDDVLREDLLRLGIVEENVMNEIIDTVSRRYRGAVEEMRDTEKNPLVRNMLERIYEDSLPRLERLGV